MYSTNPTYAARELYEDFEVWAQTLEDDEREALSWYQYGGYEDLNRLLRALGDPRPTADDVRYIESFSDDEMEAMLIQAEAIGRAIRKGRLKDDLLVFRGFKDRGFLHYKPDDELVGSDFHDNAFVSSSIDQRRAERFLDAEDGFLLQFVAPNGLRAAWLPALGLEDWEGQREILLPRGLTWEITRAERIDGVLFVEGELQQ